MADVLQVFTSVSSKEEAETIARTVVEHRLAACVQVVGPVTSTYHWQKKIETSQEWLCIAKTHETHYRALEEMIRRLHSYEVPEIVATPIVTGSQDYLDWLTAELAGA